ncbi:hypothetical protein K438DRAFT_1998158 [Mycena galopus ATCC 62051]|nr:hypothetical protein K438DRAFT_1998158 [Mycena galopus ATCC 62051]
MRALQQPLSDLPPDTQAAVLRSARRAVAWVTDSATERAAQHAQAVENLIADLRQNGLPYYFTVTADNFREDFDRCRARHNISHYFAPPRLAKMLRARQRQYEHLKYAWELQHPPLSYPDFPQDSWGWDRVRPWEMGRTWGDHIVDPAPHLLTEEHDEISPVLISKPLPRWT